MNNIKEIMEGRIYLKGVISNAQEKIYDKGRCGEDTNAI
jgi:hypothetical protein